MQIGVLFKQLSEEKLPIRWPNYSANYREEIQQFNQDKKFVKDNLIKVEIFFDSMAVTQIKQIPVVDDVEFVAELGKLIT